MRKITILLVLFGIVQLSMAQDEELKYAKTITEDDLHDYLSVLSSDALQGRETGEKGQKMAAAYIAAHFQELGLSGPVKNGRNFGYYQPVKLYSAIPGEIYVKTKSGTHANFEDIIYYGQSQTTEEVGTDIVFVGAGTEEDFKSVDVKDKAVLAVVDNPRAWRGPAENAKKYEAGMLFIVNMKTDEEFEEYKAQLKHYLSGGRLAVEKPTFESKPSGVFFIKPSAGAAIFKKDFDQLTAAMADGGKGIKQIKNGKVSFSIKQNVQEVETENVLGYLEGTDLKDELVVLTAHYDHVGMNGEEVYNGADDDGSGTSAVMEIAEAFVKAKNEGNGPRRSMLFMLVTGEEKGLLGSEYYASNPVFPLKNTIVDLNIDMIGRIDPEHKDDPNYIYLVGSDRLSTELHEISEKVNDTFSQLELDYTYNDEGHPDRIYYRSDHWNFAKNNVPIIFYFNGVHEDYHKPTDTIDKINFDMLTKRAKLVYYTAWVLANRDERPVVDKLQDQNIGSN